VEESVIEAAALADPNNGTQIVFEDERSKHHW
jgi:hypothetical protein